MTWSIENLSDIRAGDTHALTNTSVRHEFISGENSLKNANISLLVYLSQGHKSARDALFFDAHGLIQSLFWYLVWILHGECVGSDAPY